MPEPSDVDKLFGTLGIKPKEETYEQYIARLYPGLLKVWKDNDK